MHLEQIYDNPEIEKNDGVASKMLKSLKDSLGINEKVNPSFINGELTLKANNTKIVLKRESNNNTKINIKIYEIKDNSEKELNLDDNKIPPLYLISNKTFELWLKVVLGKLNKNQEFNFTPELFESFNKLDKVVYQENEKHEFSEEELNKQLESFKNNLKLEDFPEGTIGEDLIEAWVERYESQNYSGVLNSFLKMTSNGDLYTIMKECDENNVPYEMVFLAIAESNWNPYAISGVGAFGYWQIMDNTGKNEKIVIDLISKSGIVKGDTKEEKEKKLKKYFSDNPTKSDIRLDPVKSTKFAIKYLKERHDNIVINKKDYSNTPLNLKENDSWYWTMHDYNGGWTMLSKLPDFLDKTNGKSSFYGKYGNNFENISYVPRILAIKKVIKKILEIKKTIQGIKNEINNNGNGKESNDQSLNIFWLSKKLEYNGFENNLNNFKVSSQNNENKDYFNLELREKSAGNNNKIYLTYNGSKQNTNKIKRNLIELLKIKNNSIEEKSIIIKNKEITIDLKDFEKFWNERKLNKKSKIGIKNEVKIKQKPVTPVIPIVPKKPEKPVIPIVPERLNEKQQVDYIIEKFRKFYNDTDKEGDDSRIIKPKEAKILLSYGEDILKKALTEINKKFVKVKDVYLGFIDINYEPFEIISKNKNLGKIEYDNTDKDKFLNNLIQKIQKISNSEKQRINGENKPKLPKLYQKYLDENISLKQILNANHKEEVEGVKGSIKYKKLEEIENGLEDGSLMYLKEDSYLIDDKVGEYYEKYPEKFKEENVKKLNIKLKNKLKVELEKLGKLKKIDELYESKKFESESDSYLKKATELSKVLRKDAEKVLSEIGERFFKLTGKKPTVSSAIRTELYQQILMGGNVNGSSTSTHPNGTTFDIVYGGKLNKEEQIIMAVLLKEMEKEGKIFALVENIEPCFHIAINPNYKN